MTSDQTANLVYSLLFLVLVVSSLAARRLSIGQTLKYALAWAAIFAGALVLYSFRGVAGQAWDRVKQQIVPNAPVQSGQSVRVRKDEDGHFHVNAQVNGHEIKFLIDSGATTSSLSRADAEAARIAIDASGFGQAVETANGMTMMQRAKIKRLQVGSITRMDHPILVSNEAVDLSVLGMNFLSSLRSWRVEGDEMILTP